jgi:hypothetical protein
MEVVEETVTEFVTLPCCAPTPATPTDELVSRLAALHNPTRYMNDLSSGFQTIVSAHGNESMATPEDNIHSDKISDPAGTNDTAPPPLAYMSVVHLPSGTAFVLNNTCPNPMIAIVWTPPTNASGTASRTYLDEFLSTLDWWSPYVNRAVIFASACYVGKFFIYDGSQTRPRIHRRRTI